MQHEFLSPSDSAPAVHEAALLVAAAGLVAIARAWREGATATLCDPGRFLDAIESHIAALNSYVRAELKKTAWQPFSILNFKE